jgi:acetoin:2,6-dichlorophenolindophenol oxidoreductase subunit alpha
MRPSRPSSGRGEHVAAYDAMTRIRAFELAQTDLWAQGLVPGELHSSIGEEAVVVGVTDCLGDGDAMALDHRSTGPLVARGADLTSLLLEVVGSERGLCGGSGGHMHLFAPDLLAASDGIVGSSGAMACGFAVAARRLRPGSIAVAFFGEGAVNQGVLLEAWNLAVAWRLPVVFVCKDNGWSITTRTRDVTGGRLVRRARAFGLRTRSVAGWDVVAVRSAAEDLVTRARGGGGPGLLHARVHRPGGHFAGDPLLRVLQRPRSQVRELGPGVWEAVTAQPGPGLLTRAGAGAGLAARFVCLAGDRARGRRRDPLAVARRRLDRDTADAADARAAAEVAAVLGRVDEDLRLHRVVAGVR